jgi:hypothetical protein
MKMNITEKRDMNMKKYGLILISATLILVSTGCQKTTSTYIQSQQPNKDISETIEQTKLEEDIIKPIQEDNKSNISKESTIDNKKEDALTSEICIETKLNDKVENKIIKVTRKDVALDTVSPKDFSNFLLSQRIQALLLDGEIYTDEDYFKGIVYDRDVFIISDRFEGRVIDEIKVQTSIEEAISILGEPSFKDESGIYYKTKEYYLALIGEDLIEIMAFLKSPNTSEYEKDILSKILSGLERDDGESLLSEKMNDEEIGGFFDKIGHIHGGGLYYTSLNGIHIHEFFDDNYITIYNNFEGELYNIVGDKPIFPICFDNSDFLVNEIKTIIENYLYINGRFNKEGILSSGGKRKLLYNWITSDLIYFEIRTLDNTKRDIFYSVMAEDYHWLGDDHIIYIDFMDSMPYVFNIDKTEDGSVRVLENGCSLLEVSDGKVVLETKNKEKNKIVINYTIEDDGEITFERVD